MRNLIVLAALLAVSSCSLFSSDDDPAKRVDWQLISNRLWIAHMPKSERDMVPQLALIDDEEHGRYGALMKCSRFRWFIDGIVWKGAGDRLDVKILQEKKEHHAKVRVWRCKGEAPSKFELCLQLQGEKHKRVFYSMNDWVIDDIDAAEALSKQLPLAAADEDGEEEDAASFF